MKKVIWMQILLVLVVAAAITACGSINNSGDRLNGTAWILTSFGGEKPLANTEIRIEFSEDQVKGSSGCNTYFGSYTVKGDTIEFGPLAMTEMACMEPEGAMEQEQVYLQFLAEGETFVVGEDGLSILRADGETLEFAAENQ